MEENNFNNNAEEVNNQNLDINKKETVFGVAEDGKEISSARKIKGELIGGYILYGILFGIIVSVISAPILAIFVKSISLYSTIEQANKLLAKLPIIEIISIALSIISTFFVITLATKSVFKKRKVRRVDIKNVLKAIIIYEVICVALTIIMSLNSYNSGIQDVEKIEKVGNGLNSLFSYMYSSSSSVNYSEIAQKMRTYYTTDLAVDIIASIAVACGAVVLQKKLLNKNAVD